MLLIFLKTKKKAANAEQVTTIAVVIPAIIIVEGAVDSFLWLAFVVVAFVVGEKSVEETIEPEIKLH